MIARVRMAILLSILLSGCSFSTARVRQLPPEENHMPAYTESWKTVTFTKDQSLPATLNAKQSKVVRAFLEKNVVDPYRPDDATVTARALPDGTVFLILRIVDYMAPSWSMRMSATGAILNDYDTGETFIGYADGFAFVGNYFGDGGGQDRSTHAIDVHTGKRATVFNENSYLAGKVTPDPHFLPKACTKPDFGDAAVQETAQAILAHEKLSAGEPVFGTPCSFKSLLVLPFAATKEFRYGLAVRKEDASYLFHSATATGRTVYPPIYADDMVSDVVLMHSFASTESGTYDYSQEFFWALPDDIYSEPSYSESENVGFCQKHSCVEPNPSRR